MTVFMAARMETYDKVGAALQKLCAKGTLITVKAVALKAGVARATIYNDPVLLSLVQNYEAEYHYQDAYADGYADGCSDGGRDGKSKGHETIEWARGVLHIAPGEKITAELLKRKRAQLSMFFHPDKGGDTELQQALNRAFDILKRRAA